MTHSHARCGWRACSSVSVASRELSLSMISRRVRVYATCLCVYVCVTAGRQAGIVGVRRCCPCIVFVYLVIFFGRLVCLLCSGSVLCVTPDRIRLLSVSILILFGMGSRSCPRSFNLVYYSYYLKKKKSRNESKERLFYCLLYKAGRRIHPTHPHARMHARDRLHLFVVVCVL